MTFLQKSYVDYNKVEKPVLVTISYEGSNDEEELEMVLVINGNNNNYNIVGDSKSNNEVQKNSFDDNINEDIKVTLKTTINAKVVWVMKMLQALYSTKLLCKHQKKKAPMKI